MIARQKVYLRKSHPGLSPLSQFVCCRWIRPVFPVSSLMLAPASGPATLAQLEAGSLRGEFVCIRALDAGPVWSAALPVASQSRHQNGAIRVRNNGGNIARLWHAVYGGRRRVDRCLLRPVQSVICSLIGFCFLCFLSTIIYSPL
ncbi:hypothetical protein DPEC_G00186130 [Dallia pectoralis]|uniref:Uncharacterized protein n=1 Tax=Dallia pectoralis TaxID=75939 RepID=A0ACC2GBK3_DALPE|nr:hypothetical protein DPEC_G00186130 [Dallia pectoralis]